MVVAERVPDLFDTLHKHAVRYCGISPNGFDKFIFRYQPVPVLQKVDEYLKGFLAQMEFAARPPQTSASGVNLDIRETKDLAF